jgi:hypothetical protein
MACKTGKLLKQPMLYGTWQALVEIIQVVYRPLGKLLKQGLPRLKQSRVIYIGLGGLEFLAKHEFFSHCPLLGESLGRMG